MAKMYDTTEEEIEKMIGDREMVAYDLKMRKAIDILKENN